MTKLNILSRRIFLGTSALALASVASTLDQAVATSLSKAANPPQQKVRFDAGDSFVVGNLYVPADYSESTRYPAVVVAGSLTSVKEQMGGTYAAEMAQRGFVALAIDYRHYGESGGEPRQYEDPEAKAVDSRRHVYSRSNGCTTAGKCLESICWPLSRPTGPNR